jgi:hypothetical protein
VRSGVQGLEEFEEAARQFDAQLAEILKGNAKAARYVKELEARDRQTAEDEAPEPAAADDLPDRAGLVPGGDDDQHAPRHWRLAVQSATLFRPPEQPTGCGERIEPALKVIEELSPVTEGQIIPLLQKLQDAYAANQGFPTTFVIDADGLIRKRIVGSNPDKFKTLQTTVDAALERN